MQLRLYVICLQLAGTGNLREFQRLYHEDNSRLELQDVKGQTPTHLAAGKGRLNIITFIVEQCAGNFHCLDYKFISE